MTRSGGSRAAGGKACKLLAWALLAGLAVAPPARAQVESREGIALQNQILELRRDLQALQAQRGGGAPLPPPPRGGNPGNSDLAAQLLDRVATLEDEVRRLRGRVDELANSTKRAQDDLAKQIADMNFRQQNAPAPSAGPAAPDRNIAPAAPPTTPRRPPELAMQEGNAALARRDYALAETDAREVLANNRGPRSTDAQFLLAQALTGKRDYQGAAIAFDDAYNRARTGPRAPEALLGIANALLVLGDPKAACGSLDKLRAEFPATRPEIRDGAASLRSRANCR